MPAHTRAAIVTCVTANWLAPACVTLLSVARNLGPATADLIIIADGISPQDRADFDDFCAKRGLNAALHGANLTGFAGVDAGRYSPATFLRLCLPDFISADYSRLLYLDGDVLALQPLDALLTADLSGKPLGAVPEMKLAPFRGLTSDWHRRGLGLKAQQDYFNAGVLLFDWQQTLAQNLLGQAKSLLLSGRRFKFLDQDVLNLVFSDRWQALPLKWNVDQTSDSYVGVKPALRHFNHAAKPWDWSWPRGYAPFHAYYRAALAGTNLARFLDQPKRGNPLLATLEFHGRSLAPHKTFYLRRRYRHLL